MDMRLSDSLHIGGLSVTTVINKQVQLDLNSAGRARFEVITELEPVGLVELHLGYEVSNMKPYFLGVIESKYFANGRWYLTCRELLGALAFSKPFSLRHPTIAQVLDELDENIEFVTPAADYMQIKVPMFCHAGTGIEALREIGRVWQIPHYIFQQRPDGKVYVGSWQDSRWAQLTINDFPEHSLKASSSTTGEVIAIPKLRPGLKLNGRYINEVTLSNDRMQIRWSNKLLSG
ncbi:hypothetical protein [Pseudoalteromonas luteoviolacea]|uniref:Uncharacterized protein n=1 Tax=Pseudoalteromonas luteoviolacea S4060-1 TaxID=1365257 RepID=A0A167JRN8_9GAMM|nr:hypothetical protein [Pseudoalteromonas luteoviolacea]KZN61565.1 hypothetical protein N478_05725 [Pseudoalteromonas luteoviolacea S4060-1]